LSFWLAGVARVGDVLIHDYMGVDLDAVWQVTQRNVPELKKNLQEILFDLDVGHKS
jgi:uncharacterized protein with HEPN domain